MMRNGLGFGVMGSVWLMVWSGFFLLVLAFALLSVYWVTRRSQPGARKVRAQAPSVLRALEEKHNYFPSHYERRAVGATLYSRALPRATTARGQRS